MNIEAIAREIWTSLGDGEGEGKGQGTENLNAFIILVQKILEKYSAP